MFSASVLKELLLPLFDKIKENLFYLPLKSTTECVFTDELVILLSNCGIDPVTHKSSISCLNKNRMGVTSGYSSLTECFHYFIELENISMRLSAKGLSRLSFSW